MCDSGEVSLWPGRVWIALAGWIAGAATATAVGLFALSAIDLGPMGAASTPQLPATVSDVSSSGPSVSPQATPSLAPSPEQDNPIERVLNSVGGSVVARCSTAGAYLVSWSPAQGYKAEDVRRGPAKAVKVEFEHHNGGRTVMTVRCVGGTPELSVSRGDD